MMIFKTMPLFAAVLLAGCLTPSTIVRTAYFPLEPAPQVESHPMAPLTLGVRPLEVARPYTQEMTAYTGPGESLVPLPHAAWAERPGDVVTRAVTDALAATGRFADVGDAASMAAPALELTGEVRLFRENRSKEPWFAEIEARLELRRALKSGAPWAKTLRSEVPLEGNSPGAFAEAMQSAIKQIAEQAANKIAEVNWGE